MSLKSETLIVITRPVEEGAETAAYFEQKGFQVHLAPVMTVHSIAYDAERLAQYDGFIVTSQQALKSLHDDFICKGKILFAFGEKTLALARSKGFEVRELDGHDMQEAMPDLMRQLKGQPGRFCYVRGADISYDVRSACLQEEIILDESIVYETRMIADPILLPAASHYGVLLFSERSALVACQQLNVADAENIQYFCLSEKIRNSIEMFDSRLKGAVFAPEIPTTQHLYDLILRTCL